MIPLWHRIRRALALLPALGLLANSAGAVPPGANPQYKLQGFWNSSLTRSTGTVMVHVNLVRGTGGAHSQIAFWEDNEGAEGANARLWKWNPGDTIGPTIDTLDISDVPNIHCVGQSTLADGSLFVAGGHYANNTGLRYSYTLNPTTRAWTQNASMNKPRWYPTSTTLGDGSVMLTSGDQFYPMITLGGNDGEVRSDERTFALHYQPFWYDTAVTSPTIPAREDHTAIYDVLNSRMLVFGGHSASGARNDLWQMAATQADQLENAWSAAALSPDISLGGAPPARSRHGAVYDASEGSMIVFGGLDASGHALGDVWRLRFSPLRWEKIVPSNVGPGKRSGMVALYDPGPPGYGGKDRLLVFGGLDSTGTARDSAVWALPLGPGNPNPTWSALAPIGPFPRAMQGAAGIFDSYYPRSRLEAGLPVDERRAVFSGGRDRAGSLHSEVWALWMRPDTTSAPEWELLTPLPDSLFGMPPACARHAAVDDIEWDRLTISGGETPGGLSADVWALPLNNPLGSSPRWRKVQPTTPARITPRAGHTAVYQQVPFRAIMPERFDPKTGNWTLLGNAPRFQTLYPNMFLLASGRIFDTGSIAPGAFLDPATGLWSGNIPNSINSSGSVMYRPGMIFQCGGAGGVGSSQAQRIDFNGGEAGAHWVPLPPMGHPRIEHNTVLLPTGDVFVTGGVSDKIGTSEAESVRRPQIWQAAPGTWSDSLAPDPAVRDYHSTAFLLPDARIMSTGGNHSHERYYATFYWPPYLFDASGALASRPVLDTATTAAAYGQAIIACTPQAARIASACLIRAACVTHGFNQNQRFVPLQVSYCGSGHTLTLTAPADSNTVPPGDYMLFVVDSASVPSVARWVRIGGTGARPPYCASCVVTAPAAAPRPLALFSPRPNPSGPTAEATRILFDLPARTRVRLDIMDAGGRRLRTLADGPFDAGRSLLAWDRRDDRGARLGAGVYFVRLGAQGRWLTRKLVVL